MTEACVAQEMEKRFLHSWNIGLHGITISEKIVGTFTFLTPYFVTVIPFCLPSLSFSPPPLPPSPHKQCCATIALILRYKTSDIEWGRRVFSTVYSEEEVLFGALEVLSN